MDQLDLDDLCDAAIAGDADAIAELGERADGLDEDDYTILHTASDNGNVEHVRFILKEFANKNLLAKLTKNEYTALHIAIIGGHTEVAEILIDAARQHLPKTSFQAFLWQEDEDFDTALHVAVMERDIAIVKLLVEANPWYPHFPNDDGKTPMYIAVEEGYNDIVDIITTTCPYAALNGPDGSTALRINNVNQGKGGTLYRISFKTNALYAPAITGDADAIAKLEMEADFTPNEHGNTILHIESKDGNTEHVRFILRDLAHKNLLVKLNKYKQTALNLAAYFGHTEVAELLIDAARQLPPSASANDNTHNNRVTSFQAFLTQADGYKSTALHRAVTKGHLDIVKLLVEADPTDRHFPNKEGKTPMYIAVEKEFNDIVDIISTTCTAPSLDGPKGTTAARIKTLDQVKSTAGTLYKIMKKDDVYAAAIAGDADAIAQLKKIENRLYKYNETILHVCSKKGKTECVRFILRNSRNRKLLVKLNEDKKTAFDLAIDGGHTDVAAVLIEAARQHLSVNSFQAFLRQGDEDMDTPLHAAVMEGNVDIVKLLVEANPSDPGIKNRHGKTPIYKAAERGYTDIVKVISTICTALIDLDGPRGNTALQAAIKNGNPDIEVVDILIGAARLLSSSSDNDNADDNGNQVTSFQAFLRQGDEDTDTALHLAVKKGRVDIVKLLVEADPSCRPIKNHKGKTPMYIALEKGYMDIVKVICTICTAPLNMDGPGGNTALHAVIIDRNHDIEVVEALIRAARIFFSSSLDNENTKSQVSHFEAFLRKGDEDMNTALHIAVMQGNLATAKLLVEADPCDSGIQNNKGETPFHTAVESGQAEIAKMMCTTCPAIFYFFGPDDNITVLHALIKNLDEAKHEVRDVIKMIIKLIKCRTFVPFEMDPYEMELTEYNAHRWFSNLAYHKTDEYGQTILDLAVERNYVEVVEMILDIHNPDYEDYWIDADFISLMPLIYKAKDKGYKNMVNLLTERYEVGAELSTRVKNQASLIAAIGKHETEKVVGLLDEHLVNFADDLGWTALHYAVYHEFNSIISVIIEAQKIYGHQFVYKKILTTPFHIAAQKGYTSTMILLMQLWPSSSSAYCAIDKNGQNILYLAALQSKKEMIQGILQYCPEEYKNEFVNQQDNNGNTALHLLIRRGCFVAQLIKYEGLDIRVENMEKWTPPDMLYFENQIIDDQVQIKIALDHVQINQKRDIFSVLSSEREKKDACLSVKAKLMIHDKYAQMKEDIHAIANCFAEAIAGDGISKAAFEIKAETPYESGETIIHVESRKGNIENVRFIVREFSNKSLLGKRDNHNQTALHLAAQHGHTQVVEVLIDAARHLPSSSANDDTYIPVSAFQDFIRQANGHNGNTALHLAVLKGKVAIVKLLVEADPNDSHVKNNEGKTPIYIAAENGYKDIVQEICTICTALSVDGPPPGGTTALHALIARVTERASDVIQMMVNAAQRWSSSDFEALFSRTDELGCTVLELAMERNNTDAVRLILQEDPAYQHGREIKRNGLMRLIYKAIDNKYSDDIIKLLSQTYEAGIINHVHKDVLSLILAMKSRDEDSVLRLLGGAKELVTFTEDNGWAPLHYAVYHEFDSVLGAIIGAQEDVGHQFVYGDLVPTPFHVAVKRGYASTLVLLMQLWPASSEFVDAKNSPYTAMDENGRNILHLAALATTDNKKEMVQGILRYCPEKYKDKILKQQDINGDTPLHLLISHGCFIPELIKDKGLDPMAKNKHNFTPWEMLYFKNDVVADQVEIKIAIDDVQTNTSAWNLWAKDTEKKTDIWKSIPPSKRRTKDVIFDERKKKLMDAKYEQRKKDLERYKMRTNTQIIVTALITTVTFTVGFTMPGGLRQSGEVDEGLVLLSRKTAFNAFMVSDALALLLSTSSLFFYFLESMNEDPGQVAKLNAASTVLNIISVVAMMLTFIAGTYLVLSNSPALVITISIIGSLFFLLIIILLIKIVYDRLNVKRNLD